MDGFVSDYNATGVLTEASERLGTWHSLVGHRPGTVCRDCLIQDALRILPLPQFTRPPGPTPLQTPLDALTSAIGLLQSTHDVYSERAALGGRGSVCPGCMLCRVIGELRKLMPVGRCLDCRQPTYNPYPWFCPECQEARGLQPPRPRPVRSVSRLTCPCCAVTLPTPGPPACPYCHLPLDYAAQREAVDP